MTQTPTDFTPFQLHKVGVTIVGINPKRLRCDKCAQEWVIKEKGLRLPRWYWMCPKGCNSIYSPGQYDTSVPAK
jgi:hypothetical protein